MKTIEQYIETEMNGKIARKKNSPLPALIVLAVGIVLLVLLRNVPMGDSLMATSLTFGIILTAVGLVLTAMNFSGAMSHFVYLPTRSKMREKKVYVGSDDYKDIADALVSGNLRMLATVRPVASSNSALRILASQDGACVLVQAVCEHSGHFEADSEVRLLTDGDAACLAPLLKR